MLNWQFKKGEAYFAIPATPGLPKRVMLCIAKDGRRVTFSRLGEKMYRPEVLQVCGREVAQVNMADSGVCTISAASEADLHMAAEVVEAMG
jgi:hypothetical protein